MTKVGKILESLNKRRRVFSEAWNIPSNLRDKKHIKNFLDNAPRAVREYFGHTFECEDLSKYLDFKTKKVTVTDIKNVIRQDTWNISSFGIILETEDSTVIWTYSANYADRDYWAHLIHKDGTYEKIRERELPSYTGRAAKATKGYLMIRNPDPSYGMSYRDAMKVDPLDQVDTYTGKSSTIFSKTKDGLVNLMKLRKALTKIKMELTKESILTNIPKIEKIMKSGIGVELTLDGETYLLFSENNNLPSDYKTRVSSRLWPLTSDDPRDKREIVLGNGGVFRMNYFFNPDLKQSRAVDSRGMGDHFVIYLDDNTDEIKLWKNFKWSKYRGY